MSLVLQTLDRFFRDAAPAEPGDLIVVAFSGGPDSTSLLHGLARLAPARGLPLLAAHLDHGLDPGSEARAAAARRLAERLGVECVADRQPVRARQGESPEAAARRVRYRFLEEVRRAHAGRWIATAHHRDDQAETVLLRLLQGTGLEGLAGIRPIHGRVVRPFLDLDPAELAAFLDSGLPEPLAPTVDPTNRDLRVPRNRVRHALLPALESADPGATESLARLAEAALRARATLERRLEAILDPTGDAVRREAFEALPEALRPHALAFLERRAGAPYPASRAARNELARQLAAPEVQIGCDLPGGWRWGSEGPRLTVFHARDHHRPPTPAFSYTLPLPGEVEIPELGITVRVRREAVAPWMFEGSRHRAAFSLAAEAGAAPEPRRAEVRNRRPGDRLHPLGAPGRRKLKDVLIDRRVPRPERDRLPLLCVDGRIAWVPGVTVDEAFRLPEGSERDGGEAWTAEVIP